VFREKKTQKIVSMPPMAPNGRIFIQHFQFQISKIRQNYPVSTTLCLPFSLKFPKGFPSDLNKTLAFMIPIPLTAGTEIFNILSLLVLIMLVPAM